MAKARARTALDRMHDRIQLGGDVTVAQRRSGLRPDPRTVDMYWTRAQGVVSVYGTIEIPTGRPQKNGWIGSAGTDPSEKKRLYDFIENRLNAEDLDDEELRFGIPKADDGMFSATAAYDSVHAIRDSLKKKIAREIHKRVDERLNSSLIGVTESIIELATAPNVDDSVKFKAATWLYERQKGKTPDVLLHGEVKPYEEIFDEIETTTRDEFRSRKKIEASRLDDDGIRND